MNEIEDVKARIDIVDLIGQYVQLQKAGRAFKAVCPFHSEKTPSFIVSPERQSWHCFGACGTGGDVISFVMRREGMEFPEALRLLAERAGVRLQERRVSDEQQRAHERLYATNEAAARWFQSLLRSDAGKHAREYTEGRGIDAATAERFLLGYSLPTWEATRQHLREQGFTDRELLAAGLLVEGEAGSLYDRFRGRLMFPIWDIKGRVIGFGARALDDPSTSLGTGPATGSGRSEAKYINTSQTALFDKGGMLYALDRAQPGIRKEGRAVIVEGYMDAIAAHQHDFQNVVAQMGTALTERQVRLLKKLTGEIVLALDADAAGSEAAVRGHDVVRGALTDDAETVPVVSWHGLVGYQQAAAVELRIAVLPEGRDPDEVIRADAEKWRTLIAGAKPVLDYRLETSAESHDLTNPRERSQLVQEFLPLLAPVTDPVVRAHYLQRLSRLAQTGEGELAQMLGRPGPQRQHGGAPVTTTAQANRGDAREEFLLALLLQYPDLRPQGLEVPSHLVWEAENRQVLAAWREKEGTEAVKEALPLELHSYADHLLSRRLPSFDLKEAREALHDCQRRLERRLLEAEKLAMSALLATEEEELGPAVLAEAAVSAEVVADERIVEAVSLQLRDMETGLRLHAQGRSNPTERVETGTDG